MRKLFTIVLLSFVAFSCSKSLEIPSINSSSSPYRTEQEAIEDMFSFWNSIYGDKTKSNSSKPRIADVTVLSCNHETRSSLASDTDSLAYLVNFTDNSGYAVLGIRRDKTHIYALTEGGSIDPEKLKSAIETSTADLNTRSDENEDEEWRDDPDFIYHLLANAIVADQLGLIKRIKVEETIRNYDYPPDTSVWWESNVISPICNTKWGQNYPFNTHMNEVVTSDPSLQGHAPVGCVNVAIGQMIMATGYPSVILGRSGTVRYFSNFSNICTYSNYSNFLYNTFDSYYQNNSTIQNAVDGLADVFGRIALNTDSYQSASGTGATMEDAESCIHSLHINYQNHNLYSSCLPTTVEQNLSHGYPVIVSGYDSSINTGHAWLIDGSLRRCKYYAVTYDPDVTYYEVEGFFYYHFNWGWYGENDGYFADALFATASRYRQDQIDTNNNMHPSYYFNIDVKWIYNPSYS